MQKLVASFFGGNTADEQSIEGCVWNAYNRKVTRLHMSKILEVNDELEISGGSTLYYSFPTQTPQKWMFFLPSSNGFPHIPHTLGIWGQSAILAQPPFRQVLDSREAPQSGGDLRKDCRIGQSHRGPTNGWEREFIR